MGPFSKIDVFIPLTALFLSLSSTLASPFLVLSCLFASRIWRNHHHHMTLPPSSIVCRYHHHYQGVASSKPLWIQRHSTNLIHRIKNHRKTTSRSTSTTTRYRLAADSTTAVRRQLLPLPRLIPFLHFSFLLTLKLKIFIRIYFSEIHPLLILSILVVLFFIYFLFILLISVCFLFWIWCIKWLSDTCLFGLH